MESYVVALHELLTKQTTCAQNCRNSAKFEKEKTLQRHGFCYKDCLLFKL